MSEGNRTEEPTPKRQREARARGEIARSPDLTGAAIMLAVLATLAPAAAILVSAFGTLFRVAGDWAARPELSGGVAGATIEFAFTSFVRASALPLGIAFAAALVVTYAQIGTIFTLKPVLPDLARLSPVPGFKRLFGTAQLVDLAKSLLKFAVVLGLGATVVARAAPALIDAARREPAQIAAAWADILTSLGLRAGLALLAFGAIDLTHRWFRQRAKLRMTREEVTREHREEEGDPQHRAARQRLHREILSQATLDAVRRATVVVTNPTHVAIAIEWDGAILDAPRIVAIATDANAPKLRAYAAKSGVPIIEFRELARALVSHPLYINIPPSLYAAVDVALRRARLFSTRRA
ncbi:MAG: EscU/YscU/HrcU family type III secretion system export apparatus switch protein [Deltaproteobacteria bacterium]|nr:EscU/YscU/HrcU family type III secretion system export apparatus switch protein [Deltaproteobacteria bacterium]